MEMKKLSQLFKIQYGNSFDLVSLTPCEEANKNAVNFVSRTEKNNGVSAIVTLMPDVLPFEPGLITVAGSGNSVLESFIQTKAFYTGFHVFVLRPIFSMSDLEKLFYCYCIRLNQYKYNFGRQANKTLKDILVPAEMPVDWSSIDVKQLNTLKKKCIIDLPKDLTISDWKYFNLTDLFSISASSDELMDELNPGGSTPYITSSDKMNGVTDTVHEPPTNKAKTITANRGGSVGHFYYQPYPYKATPVDVRILTPKFEMNVYIGLFLKTILQREKYRHNYSRKMGSDRLSTFRIMLPARGNNPDFVFMETYIKTLPYSSSV